MFSKLREKLWVAAWIRKDNLRRVFQEKIPFWIARRLPKYVRLWVVVDVASKAMGNDKGPDEVRYKDMHDVIIGTNG